MSTHTAVQREKYTIPYRKDERFGPVLRKSWQVGQLWELHHEVIRMLLLGMKQCDIAERLGISDCQVSKIKNSQVVRDRLVLMGAARDVNTIELSKDILDVAPQALRLLRNVIEGSEEGKQATIGLRTKVAEGMLDRAGFGAVKKVQSDNVHTFYGADEIEVLKQRARIPEATIVDNCV